MAYDVFISYSSKDKPTADAACALLESRGVRCWIAPRDVAPGSDWSEAIVDAIAASGVMVLIFSENANRSPQVRREVEQAVSREVTLVPFRIENVPPCKSLHYFISVPHWLDAWSGPLETHLAKLGDRVAAILGSGAAGPAETVRGRGRAWSPAGQSWTNRARRYRLVGRWAFAGLKVAAIVAAFLFFFGRMPWPHVTFAAGEGPPTLPDSPAVVAVPAAVPTAPLAAPAFAPPSAAMPEATPTDAATGDRSAREARATQVSREADARAARESRAARDAEAARKAQAIQAAQAAAQFLRLTSVAEIGQERFCVIDGTPLREGDSFRDFVVREIRHDRAVLTREGVEFTVRLSQRTAE